MRNLAAFVNFSCDPNLKAQPVVAQDGDRQHRRIAFVSVQDIKPGEELGYRRDVNATTTQSRKAGLDCLCGAPRCMRKV